MAAVLCTGIDAALMRTRQLILEQAGHDVVLAMEEPALVAACQKKRFDVAVIGQTVTSKHKRELMALIRENCPSAKILELYRSSTGRILEDADACLEVPADVPQELAERVTALAGKAGRP